MNVLMGIYKSHNCLAPQGSSGRQNRFQEQAGKSVWQLKVNYCEHCCLGEKVENLDCRTQPILLSNDIRVLERHHAGQSCAEQTTGRVCVCVEGLGGAGARTIQQLMGS